MRKYICGKNSVLDAVKNGVVFEVLYVLKPLNLSKQQFPIKIITKEQMNQLTSLNHQGYLGVLKETFNYSSVEQIIKNRPEVILVLDHIEDPHNLGAIIRTANAAGITNLIIPKDRAVSVNETVLKVSSGGINNMKIARTNSLQATIHNLKEEGYWVYASAIDNGEDFAKVNYNFPLAIIVGNEGKGVSKTTLKQSDQNIFIPMKGSVQSLNASVAAGILIFEIIRKIK